MGNSGIAHINVLIGVCPPRQQIIAHEKTGMASWLHGFKRGLCSIGQYFWPLGINPSKQGSRISNMNQPNLKKKANQPISINQSTNINEPNRVVEIIRTVPSLKLTFFAPKNGWLEYKPFLLGRPIFRCENVSFRECIFFHWSNTWPTWRWGKINGCTWGIRPNLQQMGVFPATTIICSSLFWKFHVSNVFVCFLLRGCSVETLSETVAVATVYFWCIHV